jgi:hypothetical protein
MSALRSQPHGRALAPCPRSADSCGTHTLALENGTVLVGSDAHISPGKPTTAMASFVVGVQAVQAGFDLPQ